MFIQECESDVNMSLVYPHSFDNNQHEYTNKTNFAVAGEIWFKKCPNPEYIGNSITLNSA